MAQAGKNVFKASGVLAASLCAACAWFSPACAAKGYSISALELYLIETFAQEQIEGFIHTGASSLFDNPRVYYLQGRKFANDALSDLNGTRKKLVGSFALINAQVQSVTESAPEAVFSVSRPPYLIDAVFSKTADKKQLQGIEAGMRLTLYCKVETVERARAALGECIPLRQFEDQKAAEIIAVIRRYLAGEKVSDPNLPTYAMLTYMALVSAKLLAKDSVCRAAINEEMTLTSTDRRICGREVAALWEKAAFNPKFDSTMDKVLENLQKAGIDTSVIGKAASALD